MSERFELPAELNIYSAMEIRDALLAWSSTQASGAHENLEVSARNVENVDGAGLQLVASLFNMNRSCRLVESSEVFAEACRLMGLVEWLKHGRTAT